MKILIVEDNPLIATAIERAGANLSFTADRASDGWDAIEKLETEEYAAIVVDTDLPRHSGFGVLNYLREEVGHDLGNVVVVTSGDQDEVRRKLATTVNIVRKNDDMSELTRAVFVACGEK